ncbi:RsbT co-antagonist protein RsbRA [Alteribacillus bidgolensis]|uniref:RsbT co-antagonist protein RsbR n=1 Tax=Alteribacillus bidgolensis TaxID=930129 RepID=A0A1G8ISX8_9BACI|nr:RsbT co-antagonist protein RsbRA [Alteribacillus bidgolensis]SDI21817.1 rsbT co-antagonist protein RsbR [Alteribacillus bidgolensis]
MQPSIIEMIYSQRQEIIDRWKEEIRHFSDNEFTRSLPAEVYNETNVEFVRLIIDTLELEQSEAKEKLRQFAERFINTGWPLSYFTQGMQAFRRVLLETMTSQETINSKKVFETFYEVESWIDGIINQLVDEYSGSWENTLHLQKLALKELSAPLIPVFEKISVMPLIGTIDTERAKLIMENLLEGIIEHRSQVVLIDITGVPVVDTMVAHHIIQASEAVRLVGAECILVGIRPEIAQTIVNLGIDLGKFPTRSTLRKGIETGLELTQRKIVNISSDDFR